LTANNSSITVAVLSPISPARVRHQIGVRMRKAIFSGGQCEKSLRLPVAR
jgi:hypothetical protein